MRRPNLAPISGGLEVGNHAVEGSVQGPSVDADHLDSLVNEPQCEQTIQAGQPQLRPSAPPLCSTGVDHHYVKGLKLISNINKSRLEIRGGDQIAVLF